MKENQILSLDIGGTHVTSAFTNTSNFSLNEKSVCRKTVDPSATAEQIIAAWADCIRDSAAKASHEIGKTGIAMPGPFDYDEGISLISEQDKFRSLYKKNVRELLAAALSIPKSSILFMNDAAAFLLGEVCAAGFDDDQITVGVTLGTGLGSGLYQDGKVRDLDLWNSPFKEGIAEDYLSTRWFVNEFRNRTGLEMPGVKEIIDCSEQAELTRLLFEEFGRNLGSFLFAVSRKNKASRIIIGGSISLSQQRFEPALKSVWKGQSEDMPQIHFSRLGEKAALIGSGALWAKKPAEKDLQS